MQAGLSARLHTKPMGLDTSLWLPEGQDVRHIDRRDRSHSEELKETYRRMKEYDPDLDLMVGGDGYFYLTKHFPLEGREEMLWKVQDDDGAWRPPDNRLIEQIYASDMRSRAAKDIRQLQEERRLARLKKKQEFSEMNAEIAKDAGREAALAGMVHAPVVPMSFTNRQLKKAPERPAAGMMSREEARKRLVIPGQ